MLYECMQNVSLEFSAKNLIISVSLSLCVCVWVQRKSINLSLCFFKIHLSPLQPVCLLADIYHLII